MSESLQKAETTATQIASVLSPETKTSLDQNNISEITETSLETVSCNLQLKLATSVPKSSATHTSSATTQASVVTVSESSTSDSVLVAQNRAATPDSTPAVLESTVPGELLTPETTQVGNSTLKQIVNQPVIITSNVATVINPNSHVEHWNLDSFLPGEDKNPFGDISEEHLNQLADALSTEDVTNLLQTDFGNIDPNLASSNVDTNTSVTNKSQDSLTPDDSLKLDLFEGEPTIFDEATAHKLIKDGVHEHELAVMSAAFTDHAYAIPAHNDPSLAIHACIVTESSQTSDDLNADGIQEGSTKAKGKRNDDSPTNYPKRRSVRISDQEQKDLAEKIRQENRRKEREAKEALIAKMEEAKINTGKKKSNDETEEDGSESCGDTGKSKRGRKLKPTAKAQLFKQSRAARSRKTDDSTDGETPKGKKKRGKKVKDETTEDSFTAEESPVKDAKGKNTETEAEDEKEEKKEDESSEETETKTKGARKKKVLKEEDDDDNGSESEKKKSPPQKRRGRPPNKKKALKDDEDDDVPKKKGRPPSKKKKQLEAVQDEGITSEEDDEPLEAIKGKTKKQEDEVDASSEEESPKGKKGKASKKVTKKGKKGKEPESDEESEDETPKKAKKKGKNVRTIPEENPSEEDLPKKGKKGKAAQKVKNEEGSAAEDEEVKEKKGKQKAVEVKDKKGKKEADVSDAEKQTPKGKKKKTGDDTPKKAGKKEASDAKTTPKVKKGGDKKKDKSGEAEESEEDLPLQHLKGGKAKHKDKGDADKRAKNIEEEDVDFGAEFRYPSKQPDPSHKHRRKSHKSCDSEFIDLSMTELFKPDNVLDEKPVQSEAVPSTDVKTENVQESEKKLEISTPTEVTKTADMVAKAEDMEGAGDSKEVKVVEQSNEISDVAKEESMAGDILSRKHSSDSEESKHSVLKHDRKDSSDSRERTSSLDSKHEKKHSEKHERKHSVDKHDRKHSADKHERKHSSDSRERKHSSDSHERKHSVDSHERKHSVDSQERKESVDGHERKHSVDGHERRHSSDKLERKHSTEKHERKHSADHDSKHAKQQNSSEKVDKKVSKEKEERKLSTEGGDSVSVGEPDKSGELRKTRGKKLKHHLSQHDNDDENKSDESGELSFEDDENDSDWEPRNDPDTLYCICRKPHNNRFMICCDNCEEWYHGSCVGISKNRGKDMEKNNEEYVCPVCTKAMTTDSIQTSEAESVKTPVKAAESAKAELKVTPASASKVSSTTVTPTKEGEVLGEIKKRSAKETEEKKKQGFKAFRNMDDKLLKEQQKCIRKECSKDVRPGTIYCSDECISQHAEHSLKLIKQDREMIAVSKGLDLDNLKRPIKLHVLERKSGRLLSGSEAPTEANLEAWLKDHPTFQVIRPKVKMKLPSPYLLKLQKERKEREKQKEEMRRREREKERERLRRKREWEKEKEREKAEKLRRESEQKSKGAEGPDPIRLNVRKSLRDALANRTKDADDMMYSTNEIKALALKIEEALFNYFEDTGHKYKNKYRTLVFNIRDPKNKGLFRKILTGQIKPNKLIHMTHDDLASKELAQWREKETKHTLELIETAEKKAQKEPVVIRKKTHKGEIELDEDLSSLAETLLEEKPSVPSSTDDTKKEDGNEGDADENVPEVIVDTTDQHRAHLFDLNCKICTGKQAPAPQEPETKKMKVEHKVKESKEVKKEKESAKQDLEAETEEMIKEVMDVIHKEDEKPKPSQSQPSSSNEAAVIVRSPDSALSSGLDSKPKFKPQGPRLWKGFIAMQDLAKFFTSAYKVSGPTNDLNLPDTVAVCGRIAPDQMWDYLAKIRQGGSRDICIIRFIPGSDDEKVAYIHLYSYLNSRGRCGVVGNAPKHVKDFYIVPLASHGHIPRVLKPFDGPGLEDNRPHMLLGIIIRQKLKRASQSEASVLPKLKEEASTAKKAKVQTSVLPPKDPRLDPRSNRGKSVPSPTDPAVIRYKPTKLEELKASSSSSSTSSSPELGSISKDPIVKAFTDPKTADASPRLSISLPYSPGGGVEDDDDDDDPPYDPGDHKILAMSSQPAVTSTSVSSGTSSSLTTSTVTQSMKQLSSPSTKKKLKQLDDTEAITGIKVDEIVDKIAKSTDPAQITAMMVTILACATDATEQKVLLTELTNRVEKRKQDLIKQTLGIEAKFSVENKLKVGEKEKSETKLDVEKPSTEIKTVSFSLPKAGKSDPTKFGELERYRPIHSEMTTPVGFYKNNSAEPSTSHFRSTSPKKSIEIVKKHIREDAGHKSEKAKESVESKVVTTEATTSSSDVVEADAKQSSANIQSSETATVKNDEMATTSESSAKSIPISISETKTGDMPLALQALMKDVMGESSVRLQKPRLPARFAVSDKGKDSQGSREENTDENKASNSQKENELKLFGDPERKDKKADIQNLIPGLGYLDTDSDDDYSGSPHLFMKLVKNSTDGDSSVSAKEKSVDDSKKDEVNKKSKDKQIELSKSDLDMRSGQVPDVTKSVPEDVDLRTQQTIEDIDERIKLSSSLPLDKDDRLRGPQPMVNSPTSVGPPGVRPPAPEAYSSTAVRPPPIRIPHWGPGNPPPPGVDDPITPETKIRPPPGVALRFQGIPPPPPPPFAAPLLPPRLGFPADASVESIPAPPPDEPSEATTEESKKDMPEAKEDTPKDSSKTGSPEEKKEDISSKKVKKDKGKDRNKNKNKTKKNSEEKPGTEDVDERILPPIIPGVPMTVSLPGIPVAISVVPPKPSIPDTADRPDMTPQWPGQTDIDQRMYPPGMPNPMMPPVQMPVSSVSMAASSSPMMPPHPVMTGPNTSMMGGMNIPPNPPPMGGPMPVSSVQPAVPPASTAPVWAAHNIQHYPPEHMSGQHPPEHPHGPPPPPPLHMREGEQHSFSPSMHGNQSMAPGYTDIDFRQQDIDLRGMNPPGMPPAEYHQSSPNPDVGYSHKRPYDHEHPNEPHGKRSRTFGGPGGYRSESPSVRSPSQSRDSKPPSLMSLKFDTHPEAECTQSPNEIDYFEKQEFIGGYYHGMKNPRGGGWNYRGQRGGPNKYRRRDFPPRNLEEEQGFPPPEMGEERPPERHEHRGFGRERRPWGPRHDRRGPRDPEAAQGYHYDDSRHREGFHRGRRRDNRDYRR